MDIEPVASVGDPGEGTVDSRFLPRPPDRQPDRRSRRAPAPVVQAPLPDDLDDPALVQALLRRLVRAGDVDTPDFAALLGRQQTLTGKSTQELRTELGVWPPVVRRHVLDPETRAGFIL